MRLLERRLASLKRADPNGRDEPSCGASEPRLDNRGGHTTAATTTPDTLAAPLDEKEEKTTTVVKSQSPMVVGNSSTSSSSKLARQLNAVNSLAAIRLKMLLFGSLGLAIIASQLAEAGFFTFYFPNIFKPKGFGELSDMIKSLEGQINEAKDNFQDIQYFWGQLEQLDSVDLELDNNNNHYPEESACSEVFPLFRGLAINYVHLDYNFYIKPLELYLAHVQDFRDKWYPAGLESKAALPREWEQKLMERELELKIEWLSKLVTEEEYRAKRSRMVEIWTSVRRSLDTSVPCLYLRYAYRQVAEDINQVALESNLEGMQEAIKLLVSAYKRIERFKDSDAKIKQDIEEELIKFERFTIKS